MLKRVFIVRHGETDYNVEQRWQGNIDAPLNALGIQQAQKLAEHFLETPLDAIISSDLSRAYDTALAVAKPKGLEILTDQRLREISLGVFEGLTRADLIAQYPIELSSWDADESFAPPQGESRNQVQLRLWQAWQDISQREEENLLILSHGGSIRLLLKKLIPKQVEGQHFGNTSISILERDNETWRGVLINKTPHLK